MLYRKVLELLDAVHRKQVSGTDLLTEVVRLLIVLQDESQGRLQSLIRQLKTVSGGTPLSSESIVKLVGQHLALPGTSRLPVLIVAAAYRVAEKHLGEQVSPLLAHNAADRQTGALGDLEITLSNDQQVVTCYEMKDKRLTRADVERALQKLSSAGMPIDNYIFVTTEEASKDVQDYIFSLYKETGGIEFAVLDCLGFLRHFLHLFHRLRSHYLEAYQELMLTEPDSSVSHVTKEAFLAMRNAAEASVAD